MYNGYTPTPTNPERRAYDAERKAYWAAKSLAYALAHDPRMVRRAAILAACRDEPINHKLYAQLAEIDASLQIHPSDTLQDYFLAAWDKMEEIEV